MTFKYQDQIERVAFPDCEKCIRIRDMINDPTLYSGICGQMICSREFWMFKDITRSADMAILGLQTVPADPENNAIYHPDLLTVEDLIFMVHSTAGPTGDTYTYKDILQPLLFEATRHIQDKLVELSTERIPWLQLDEAAAMMAEIGFYRTIHRRTGRTKYIKYPLGSLKANIHLAPEHDTGLEFGYGSITDIQKLPGFDATSLYADKAFRKPTKWNAGIHAEKEETPVVSMAQSQSQLNLPQHQTIRFPKKES